ncbi:UDP-N-acetylmuramoyl-tripeptide--D-alanyl-D-alanine ligase [Lachnospiraceae bacterium PF1-22]|uniref:UDP-N-acetylmuramoyl-tripeptide--D-alanyl-D- alanine ligase n=1 Tax=Ohessyouella blattaphilus TaxID=2949333 RepID=UPI0025615433|nr:UDP-N-acetylmuramoyl-tripeptide--D-alanyl-D-alanine ligase [Lachnospiraceae bacterium OttesenSCG-928-J05]
MRHFTLNAIMKACEGTFSGNTERINDNFLNTEVDDIVIDSRKVKPGVVFVAIDGENVDAHQFIPGAISAGALLVISHQDLGTTDFPYLLVKNTGQALLDIASAYRDSFTDLKVIGITGSVGKTSTKEMVAAVLSTKYQVHKTLGNFNNEWGLPLSIFTLKEGDQISVLELGVNHFGEMRRLSKVAGPDIGVITNIGIAHLEFFKTREGILKEKSSMLEDIKEAGRIFLNGDDDLLRQIATVHGTTPCYYGLEKGNDLYATHVESLGLRGSKCLMHLPNGNAFYVHVPAPGIHMVKNAIVACGIGQALGLSTKELTEGVNSFVALAGRNHLIDTGNLIILDDCYNANPVSMKASLDVLALGIGRKVAVLGDMGELGPEEAALHAEVGAYAASLGINRIYGIGPLSKHLVEAARGKHKHTEVHWFPDKDTFISEMRKYIEIGDNVLVKASHGMDLPQIIEALKNLY